MVLAVDEGNPVCDRNLVEMFRVLCAMPSYFVMQKIVASRTNRYRAAEVA